jgi:hypothetical protein
MSQLIIGLEIGAAFVVVCLVFMALVLVDN